MIWLSLIFCCRLLLQGYQWCWALQVFGVYYVNFFDFRPRFLGYSGWRGCPPKSSWGFQSLPCWLFLRSLEVLRGLQILLQQGGVGSVWQTSHRQSPGWGRECLPNLPPTIPPRSIRNLEVSSVTNSSSRLISVNFWAGYGLIPGRNPGKIWENSGEAEFFEFFSSSLCFVPFQVKAWTFSKSQDVKAKSKVFWPLSERFPPPKGPGYPSDLVTLVLPHQQGGVGSVWQTSHRQSPAGVGSVCQTSHRQSPLALVFHTLVCSVQHRTEGEEPTIPQY